MSGALVTQDHELHLHGGEELHTVRDELEEEIHAIQAQVAEIEHHLAHDEELAAS